MHGKSTYFKNTTQYSSNNIHNYPPYFFSNLPVLAVVLPLSG